MNYLSAEQVEDDVLGGPCPRPLITAFTRPAAVTSIFRAFALPRRSRELTQFCSPEVTQTWNTIR